MKKIYGAEGLATKKKKRKANLQPRVEEPGHLIGFIWSKRRREEEGLKRDGQECRKKMLRQQTTEASLQPDHKFRDKPSGKKLEKTKNGGGDSRGSAKDEIFWFFVLFVGGGEADGIFHPGQEGRRCESTGGQGIF